MLLAGQIGKPHGMAGEVYVIVISDDPRRFQPGSTLYHADGRVLTVERVRPHRDRTLVKFAGIDDRAVAEDLRGPLYVPAEQVRDLAADEYWPEDLVGCVAADSGGGTIGTVTRVIEGAAQDLLVLDTPAGERLVPMVKEIVVSVDTSAHRIILDPPEGLI